MFGVHIWKSGRHNQIIPKYPSPRPGIESGPYESNCMTSGSHQLSRSRQVACNVLPKFVTMVMLLLHTRAYALKLIKQQVSSVIAGQECYQLAIVASVAVNVFSHLSLRD